MKYLFYDLEYATSKGGNTRICEFGYVVTDETFRILGRDNFIINPNITGAEWDYFAVRKILTRSIKEYEECPSFPYFYQDIKKLVLSADYVIGHSLNSDAKALNLECKRYDFPSIDYDFYDVKKFYKDYSNTKKDTSVTNILAELNVKGEKNVHDAETDAVNTMLELKVMLNNLNSPFEELIELCPEAKDRTENYLVKSIEENREKQLSKVTDGSSDNNDIRKHGNNRKRYLQFLDNVKPKDPVGNKFKDKKVSISINYEEHHYRQILNLIQLIVNEGGTVILKASLSDIFVKYDVLNEDGTTRRDSKLDYVIQANSKGCSIEIIEFSELLDRLGITEQQLDEMSMVSFDFLMEDGAIIKDKRDKALIERRKKESQVIKTDANGNKIVYEEKSSGTTLGDLFGDVFAKFLEEDDNDDK